MFNLTDSLAPPGRGSHGHGEPINAADGFKLIRNVMILSHVIQFLPEVLLLLAGPAKKKISKEKEKTKPLG